jgi:hypothetical protein
MDSINLMNPVIHLNSIPKALAEPLTLGRAASAAGLVGGAARRAVGDAAARAGGKVGARVRGWEGESEAAHAVSTAPYEVGLAADWGRGLDHAHHCHCHCHCHNR